MPRPAIALGVLVLALITARCGAGTIAASAGSAAGHRLARVAAAMRVGAAPPEVDAVVEPAPPVVIERPASAPPRATRVEGDRGRAIRAASKPAPATAALEISADRVARLNEAQLRSLHAIDGVDANGRALGAQLYGFSALGVGLADGDVVTGIDGRATPDVGTALAAAIHAYASGQDAARATVVRDGQPLLVTVRIPRKAAPASGQNGL